MIPNILWAAFTALAAGLFSWIGDQYGPMAVFCSILIFLLGMAVSYFSSANDVIRVQRAEIDSLIKQLHGPGRDELREMIEYLDTRIIELERARS